MFKKSSQINKINQKLFQKMMSSTLAKSLVLINAWKSIPDSRDFSAPQVF
jgi:hypothetical protein